MDYSILFANFDRLEKYLNIPSGFLEKLINEDDWSFIIKSHAIIKASITDIVVENTDKRLIKVINRLPFSGGQTSKLSLAIDLELVDDYSREFIKLLSELRNQLVHNVNYLAFTFDKYIKELPDSDRSLLGTSITKAIAANEWKTFEAVSSELVLKSTKVTIMFAVLGVLARILFKIDPKEYELAAKRAEETVPKLALLILVVILIGSLMEKNK